MADLETYFEKFRKNIIGYNQIFETPYGNKRIIYADWIASGRLYTPIEKKISEVFGPFVGNTHTETSVTGTSMTRAYHAAHKIIKQHVNANKDDVIITAGSGMTAVINKFQRILGLKVPEELRQCTELEDFKKPVVFITHMEHHSNQTSWLETIADVVVIEPDEHGLIDLEKLRNTIQKYNDSSVKIGSFSACSNVTGIRTPYHEMAKIMHEIGGLCFIDFAASAPYVNINMHPDDPMEKLDAIFFSPHKFLGGPGSSGVLIFDSNLYKSSVPDNPGGGTVNWTDPWGLHKFIDDIEIREDGGTPGFLQAIRAALCIKLKEEMCVKKMMEREDEIIEIVFKELTTIPNLHILADNMKKRLSVFSFYIDDIHFNLVVKLLNDRFGVQVRGGCSCAGTYGHYLLHIKPKVSKEIFTKVDHGDFSVRPGWVRLSLHPTVTNEELYYILDSIKKVAKHAKQWGKEYKYYPDKNEYFNKSFDDGVAQQINTWFELE